MHRLLLSSLLACFTLPQAMAAQLHRYFHRLDET